MSDTRPMGGVIRGTLKFVVTVLVVAGAVVGVLKYRFVDVTSIDNNGMAPTLESGDQFLVWRDATPDTGNVVVCRHPLGNAEVVGRVLAAGDQEVSSERGQLQVNGRSLNVNWQTVETFVEGGQPLRVRRGREEIGASKHDVFMRVGATIDVQTTRVPTGQLYLLADNRSYASRDSRSYGPVDAATCRVAFMRWKPSETSPNQLGSWLDVIH